jgi:UDP-GlcNAc:undecaprenyl-phosphate GlcNAc-1-phosphate transferase
MNKENLLYFSIYSFFICFLICYFRNKIANYFKIIDNSNNNKIHAINTPLVGGLLFFSTIIPFLFIDFFFSKNLINSFLFDIRVISNKQFFTFILALVIIFFLGLYDDIYNLSANYKMLLFVIVIYFFLLSNSNFQVRELIFFGFDNKIYFGEFSIFFTLFCFLLSLNAFNMFDGINLQSFTLYSSFLFIFYLKGFDINFIIIFLISLIFFFCYNYSGKIFLGNGGAYFLSFLFSLFIIINFNFKKNFYIEEIFLYMLLPGIDMFRLFFMRIINGKHPFIGDLNHFHHIILKKFGFKKTLIILITLLFYPIILLNFFFIHLYILIISVLILYFLLIFNFKKLND